MAILFVNDGGSDTSPYETWAKAANDIVDAFADAACVAGSTIYIASNHSQTQAATLTLGSASGTNASPVTVISVTEGDETTYQTMIAGGGKIEATGAGTDIVFNNSDIYVGVNIAMDDAADDMLLQTNDKIYRFIDSTLKYKDDLALGASASDVAILFEDVNLVQEGTGNIAISGGSLTWNGGTSSFGASGACNTTLFLPSTSRSGNITVSNVDFQDLDAGDYLVANARNVVQNYVFRRCKVPAALAGIVNGSITGDSFSVKAHSVTSADIVYQFEEHFYGGSIVHATNCKLTGDWSAKMVSLATTFEWKRPLRFKLAEIYSAANPTVTVNCIHDQQGSGAGSDLQDDEFWIEVEYPLASAQLMLGNIASSKPATIVTAASDLSNNAEGWTEDLANEVKQEAAVTIADGGAGIHTVWACVGKASATVYVDPIPVLS